MQMNFKTFLIIFWLVGGLNNPLITLFGILNDEYLIESNYNASLNIIDKEIHGKVIKIADGDTFTMIFDNDFDVRVRLNGIDCPEKNQPFSKRAKQLLSDFIFGKMVVVQYKEKDRYGRVIGDVFVDGLNINYEMVKLGLAWHFKRYSDDDKLDSLEKDARYKGIGIWSDKNPIPPWEWRKGIR
jgi:micrococcal nuclease